MDSKKVNQAIVSDLSSGELQKQMQAIEHIGKEGSVHYLALLARLFVQSSYSEIKDKISILFQDVRDPDARIIIVDLLKHTSSRELRSMLLTACWSSRIDYSLYVTEFVRMAIEFDYLVAFEVLTIIENLDSIPSKLVLDESLRIVKQAIKEDSTPKGDILREIEGILIRITSN